MTEEELIDRARTTLSRCYWVVGECASIWTQRFARGRSDAAFGELIDLSADQVYQRRRVWETFADVRCEYSALSWSHFYTALNWEDSAECLQWAEEMEATVGEMRAWRRAAHGEDLSIEADDEADQRERFPETAAACAPVQAPVAASVSRDQGEYAPFRAGASAPVSDRGETAGRGPAVSPPGDPCELIAKRVLHSLQLCLRALEDANPQEFRRIPEPLDLQLIDAARAVYDRISDLRSGGHGP